VNLEKVRHQGLHTGYQKPPELYVTIHGSPSTECTLSPGLSKNEATAGDEGIGAGDASSLSSGSGVEDTEDPDEYTRRGIFFGLWQIFEGDVVLEA
jgi:hypothetical protein